VQLRSYPVYVEIARKPTAMGFLMGSQVVLRVYRRSSGHVLTRVRADASGAMWVDRPDADVDHGLLKRTITAGKTVLRVP
jgi:hypothetical protein